MGARQSGYVDVRAERPAHARNWLIVTAVVFAFIGLFVLIFVPNNTTQNAIGKYIGGILGLLIGFLILLYEIRTLNATVVEAERFADNANEQLERAMLNVDQCQRNNMGIGIGVTDIGPRPLHRLAEKEGRIQENPARVRRLRP